ncbi:Zn-dependent hydrolases [alpha proteobacterium U9-1i]|nr:Zn-dependent hydrolases [alpha proteobacterium U9-1i]
MAAGVHRKPGAQARASCVHPERSGDRIMLHRRTLLAAAAAAALPSNAMAQTPSDAGARVEQLTDNAFAILHDNATDEWPHSNVGVIVGRRSVFVIDSNYLPSRAVADIALIRQITDKPVSHLVTTHWHFDHNNGAIAYRDAFPNVELIAERETARWIELNQTYWQRLSTAPESARRAALTTLEQELATGAALTAEERAARTTIIAQRQNEMRELGELRIVTPERVFDGQLNLNFEGTRIEIKDWGPANSPHDATIWLPRERILFAGDILVQSPLPYTGASWPVHWAQVLRQIEAMPIAKLVPGHGPVMTDHSYTRAVGALMEATLTRVEAMVREGKTLAQVQDDLNLDDVRAAVPVWNGPDVPDDDWTYTRRTLAERAFVGLRGQGGR